MQYQIGDKVKVEFKGVVVGIVQYGENINIRVERPNTNLWDEVDSKTAILLERGGVKVEKGLTP